MSARRRTGATSTAPPRLGPVSHKIVGLDNGQVIFEDETGYRYVSGETPEDYGLENMTVEERAAIRAPEYDEGGEA